MEFYDVVLHEFFLSDSNEFLHLIKGCIELEQSKLIIGFAVAAGDSLGSIKLENKINSGYKHDLMLLISSLLANLRIVRNQLESRDLSGKFDYYLDQMEHIISSMIRLVQPTAINERKWCSFSLFKLVRDEIATSKSVKIAPVKILYSISNAVPIKISSCKFIITQMLRNLLFNSFQNTLCGLISVEVSLNDNNQGLIDISVCDTGCGMPDKYLNYLLGNAPCTDHKGGISIIRDILDQNPDLITLTASTSPKGTKVVFTVPWS